MNEDGGPGNEDASGIESMTRFVLCPHRVGCGERIVQPAAGVGMLPGMAGIVFCRAIGKGDAPVTRAALGPDAVPVRASCTQESRNQQKN